MSIYNSPGDYKVNIYRKELIYFSLTPNKRYYLYLGDDNISSACIPITKDTNYDDVYNYMINNIVQENVDVYGAHKKHDSHFIHRQILFAGYNRTSQTAVASNVINYGEIGDPLVADKNGFLALIYYANKTNLDAESSLTSTPLTFGNAVDVINKNFILKTSTDKIVAQYSSRENYKNLTTIDNNVKTV